MENLQLVFVAVQYLCGGILAFLVSLYVFSKNSKSWACRSFLLFGLCVSLWAIFVFFHRIASTQSLSSQFFIISSFFISIAPASLLVTLLMLNEERKLNLVFLPLAGVAGGLFVMSNQFMVVSTEFGWSYVYSLTESLLLFYLVWIGWTIGVIIVGGILAKKSKVEMLKKKFTLVTSGFVVFYTVGFTISNLLILYKPASPPLGGVFVTSAFLVVAYAINLPTEVEEISILRRKHETIPAPSEFSEIMYLFQKEGLAASLKSFLEDYLEAMPGKELGQDLLEFDRFLGETGLSNVVFFRKGEIVFDRDRLSLADALTSMDKILKYVRDKRLTAKAMGSLIALFLDVYRTARAKSKPAADEWLRDVLQRHRDFLSAYDFLDRLPPDVKPGQ